MKKSKVAIFVDTGLKYPRNNFDPPEKYPEYPYEHLIQNTNNRIYDSVRQLMVQLGLDKENLGSSSWNPLGRYINKGNKVVIKPNFVIHQHPNGSQHLDATITHASILRTIIDYAYIATGPEGIIDVVDCPLDMSDFGKALEMAGAKAMFEDLRVEKKIEIPITDLRRWEVYWKEGDVRRYELPGDPHGYRVVDLGADSELLRNINPDFIGKYRSTASFFEKKRITEWHNTENNLYSFSQKVLQSDVFINIPKMKTHKKAGVTLSLKNIFGVTDAKDTLPHHRIGKPSEGGDEIPENASLRMTFKAMLIEKIISNPNGLFIYKLVKPLYNRLRTAGLYGKPEQRDRGEWYGNNTVWRTTLDLNKVLVYADDQGKLHQTPQRKVISLVDGIIAGDQNGPLQPNAVKCGFMAMGDDPVAVDLTCVRFMGFDWNRLPTYSNIKNIDRYFIGCSHPDEVEILPNNPSDIDIFSNQKSYHAFEPANGWKGAIEL